MQELACFAIGSGCVRAMMAAVNSCRMRRNKHIYEKMFWCWKGKHALVRKLFTSGTDLRSQIGTSSYGKLGKRSEGIS